MKVPVTHLKKQELIYLGTHRCKAHGHTYLEHYNCFLTEQGGSPERIGFFDIETSNLNANFGVILCWSIKELNGKIKSAVLSSKDFARKDGFKIDKRIIKELLAEMKRYDRIVTHYGRKFDFPFLRTRALICGLKFPEFGTIVNDDTWYMARYKLKLNSSRLDVIARAILGKTEKTHLDGKVWVGAARGNRKYLNYILKHNQADVRDLEKVWLKLKNFVGRRHTSI
ncbi:MAG: ribonuclease H-like domain-containing protein [Fervidobacterium sp.]